MRYYELDVTGKIKGSYAVDQPEKTLHFLEEHPEGFWKRDGVPGNSWIVDDDLVAAADAVTAAKAKKDKAAKDLKDLIVAQGSDSTKITLKQLVDRVLQIELYLGF